MVLYILCLPSGPPHFYFKSQTEEALRGRNVSHQFPVFCLILCLPIVAGVVVAGADVVAAEKDRHR